MPDFNQQLRTLRKKNNLTQKQLADQLDVSLSTIIKYERGDREPNIQILKRICAFFNVTIDYLLGLDECPEISNAQEKSTELYHDLLSSNPVLSQKMKDIIDERRKRILYQAHFNIAIKYHFCTPQELSTLSLDELSAKMYEYGKKISPDKYETMTDEIFTYLTDNNYFSLDIDDVFNDLSVSQRRLILWQTSGAEYHNGLIFKDPRHQKLDKILSEEEALAFLNAARVIALKYGICTFKQITETPDHEISELVSNYEDKLSGDLRLRFIKDELRELERQGFDSYA